MEEAPGVLDEPEPTAVVEPLPEAEPTAPVEAVIDVEPVAPPVPEDLTDVEPVPRPVEAVTEPGPVVESVTAEADRPRPVKKARKPAKKAAKRAAATGSTARKSVKKSAKKAKSTARKAAKTAAPGRASTPSGSGWVDAEDGACPQSHPVKAKLASRIFHLPGMAFYDRTRADRCYADEAAAEADGLTRSKR